MEYYKLPYCQPDHIVSSAENLGEVLRGDRIFNSLYQIQMRLDERCKVVCRVIALTPPQVKTIHEAIEYEYRVNMILDNLPAAEVRQHLDETGAPIIDETTGQPRKYYERGFPVGVKVSESEDGPHRFYINNHARFTILYHRDADTDLARIVGFEVEPASVRHEYDRWDDSAPRLKTCAGNADEPHPLGESPQIVAAGEEIVFTYDVVFKSSPVRWASRWDTYLQTQDREIHWFSVVNSAMILLFLSGMVAMIMIRTLRRDITQYNQLETVEETAEETGWKLVHGDVFRPPPAPGALSVCIGTGSQLLGMTFVTMIFAVLGFLSPANRGGLMTAMLLLFVFMGVPAGYSSAFLHKSLKGTDWKKNIVLTSWYCAQF